MSKRHKDALMIIDPGACNPSGIAHSIVEACAEIRATPNHRGTAEITSDPAVRLMVHQLGFLCGVGDGSLSDNYNEAYKACVDALLDEDNVVVTTVPVNCTCDAGGSAGCPVHDPQNTSVEDAVLAAVTGKSATVRKVAEERGIPYVDVALEEGTRFERLFDGNDQGG